MKNYYLAIARICILQYVFNKYGVHNDHEKPGLNEIIKAGETEERRRCEVCSAISNIIYGKKKKT